MLSDSAARWLLVAHTAFGVAAVATATHLVVWLRGYLAGRRPKQRVVWFAALLFTMQLGAFVLGNAMYPTYKVEVRAAYLENATAVASQQTAHEAELARIAAREGEAAPAGEATAALVARAAHAARWFDVKEHWIALGILTSGALWLVLALWDRERDGAAPVIGPIVMGLATIAAGTVWLGAIIGIVVASWRAV